MPSPDPEKVAMQVFSEMADGGCSLKDAITAVYLRGRQDAGEPPVKVRKRLSVPPCPYEEIVGVYNDLLTPPLAAVRSIASDRMNKQRRESIRQVWEWVLTSERSDGTRRATTAPEGLEWFRGYFERASHSDWIMGRDKQSRGWKGDLDYLMTTAGMKRVIEKTEVPE